MKKVVLSALFFCALCVTMPPMASFAQDQIRDKTQDQLQEPDQIKDKDQTKDQLQDGSCQTVDPAEVLEEVGAL